MQEKLSNQNFYHDLEEVIESSMQQQKENTKALTTGNEDLGKTNLQGGENYNQITRRNNEILSNLIMSNAIDSGITTTLTNLMITSNEFNLI